MKRQTFTFLIALLLSASALAQLPKGDRTLGWQVDMAENANYDSAFAYAADGCVESVHLFITWSALEPDTGQFDATTIANFLDVINLYFPFQGIKAELQLAPTNTVTREVPSELVNVDFDDPVMIRRFKQLLDTVFAHIPDLELTALNIGNETDVLFANDAAPYGEFKTFLDSVAPYANQHYQNLHGENLIVGTTFTMDGLIDPTRGPLCQNVNATRDVVSVTYYPTASDFTMQPPSQFGTDVDELLTYYPDPNQDLYFVECGYSSSAVCNSSEAQQAQFYEEVFAEWDDHLDRIPYLTIFKTTDWSQAEVDSFGIYYGITDNRFLEFLRALGVRTWPGDGANKLAYEQIQCELEDRSWCSAAHCGTISVAEPNPENEWNLFPNPFAGQTTLTFDRQLEEPHTLEVFDQQGRVVMEQAGLSGTSIRIDARDLPAGLYSFRLRTAQTHGVSGRMVVLP